LWTATKLSTPRKYEAFSFLFPESSRVTKRSSETYVEFRGLVAPWTPRPHRAERQRAMFGGITDNFQRILLEVQAIRGTRPVNLKVEGPTAGCVTCPECGAWVVIQKDTATMLSETGSPTGQTLVTCPNPKCARPQFKVEDKDIREFSLSLEIFLRGYFYPSELWV